MKIMKPVLTVAVVSALMVVSCFAGSKLKKNYVRVIDPKTGQLAQLEAPDKAVIMVVGPDGIEVGVLYATKDDNSAVLIAPQSLVTGSDDKQPDKPAPQNQSDQERLDHAGLMKISR